MSGGNPAFISLGSRMQNAKPAIRHKTQYFPL